MKHVLVTYASKYGSTAEIAAAIATTLKADNIKVDLYPVQQIELLSPYDAVIVGSAIYAGHWLHDAAEFLKRFEDELSQIPVWLFSSGPTSDEDMQRILKDASFPKELLPLTDHITPRDIAMFHGKISMRSLNLAERLIIRAMHVTPGDFREWDEVKQWTLHIREEIGQPA
ncbi:MAG TPA: flavodoxin domain-containing protein [Phototrophicaceae bacterium]|jgi:menaquinone-dependent protoporphyrinogen oxidase|nr:flavodoxin domain-containing protein [Phototrophicaceae bacterium]